MALKSAAIHGGAGIPDKRQKADRSYGRPLGRYGLQKACCQQHAQAGINGERICLAEDLRAEPACEPAYVRGE